MIVCADCGADSQVKDSRPVQNTVRRRRKCLSCGATWTTFEIDRESILKLREASRLFSELETHRKRMADLVELASSFDELESLASSGRGRTPRKLKLAPRVNGTN